MNVERGVLVFCEGSHDVIFVQRALGQLAGFKYFEGSVAELPTPLGSEPEGSSRGYILERNSKDRSQSKVRSLNSPEEPTFESVLEKPHAETIYVLLKRGHNGFGPKERTVVDDLRLFEGRRGIAIQSWAVAILTDADDAGREGRAKQLTQTVQDWVRDPGELRHGTWTRFPAGPVGLFVFSRPEDGKGTLDDHLAAIIRQDPSIPLAAAERFIDSHKTDGDRVSKRPADRLKAMMTAAGQFKVPGKPLSEVISHNGPLPSSAFGTDLGQELVGFLLAVNWTV